MRLSPILLALLLLVLSGQYAEAQIQAILKLDRKIYVTHEPITGTLTLVNRAGRDLIFGDSGGSSWLDFTVTDARGHLITPVRGRRNADSLVLSAGQTYKHKVVVNRYYPMNATGQYRVRANIAFPQIDRVFQSQTSVIQVTDGQPMWNQVVGVPAGHPQAGTYREYSLMTYYHGARNRSLYFRLKDNDTGSVYKTYPIGEFMSVRPPVYAVDKTNKLHVLHMTTPSEFKYTVINVDGDITQQQNFYEKKGNRPQLKSNDFGEVTIIGGYTQEEIETPYEQTEFRRLSERPPGLPTR